MSLKNMAFLGVLLVGPTPMFSQAKGVDFSIGGGYPFFVVPEVSFASSAGDQRWFANYKIGLDDGFSVGFDQGVGADNKHVIGGVIGALGTRDDKRPCGNGDSVEDIGSVIGNAIGCAFSKAFDEETTNGIGLSYSYHFNGLNNVGMRIRFELGYGEAADSNEKRADGGVIISYQF
jgi:hypothetical protein